MDFIKNVFKITGYMLLAGFILAGCSKTSKDEQANELLAGTWKATSIKDKSNLEFVGGTITENNMYFRKDSGNLGYMNWKINMTLVNLSFEGDYQIRDDGTRLLFGDDYEFLLDVNKNTLNMTLLENTGNINFIAERQ